MKRFIKHMAIPALCCIMTLTLFRVFFFLGYVPTSSMEPTIRQGSFIVAARMAYWSSEPKVGDIIVFSHDGKVLVKRVAAVAGEAAWTWKGPETVPCGMLYLLGDNIDASIDSRLWVDPFVPVENVIARYRIETGRRHCHANARCTLSLFAQVLSKMSKPLCDGSGYRRDAHSFSASNLSLAQS